MNAIFFQFDSFIVDCENQKLYKDRLPTQIQRKLYDILLLFIENAGNLVTREQLIENVWEGKEIDERNLTQHIYNLRRLLGDNPRSPSFILTIPGKGYTFSYPVRQLDRQEVESILNESEPAGGDVSIESDAVESREIQPRLTPKVILALKNWKVLTTLGIMLVLAILILVAPNLFGRMIKTGLTPVTYPRILTLATTSGYKTDPVFSPTGRQIALSSGQSSTTLDIFVSTSFDSSSKLLNRITNHPLSEHSPSWSPDGKSIAFLRGDLYAQRKIDLVIASSAGGDEKTLTQVWGGLDWSPDGRYLAVIDDETPDTPSSVFLLSPDGTERIKLTEPVLGEWRFDSTPRFSHDGKSVALIRWRGDLDGDIWVVDIATKRLRQITFDRLAIADLRWSADDSEILFVSGRIGVGRLWRQKIDEKTPTLIDSMVSDIDRFDVHPLSKRLVFTQYSQSTSIEVWPPGKGPDAKSSVNRSSKDWVCRIDSNTSNLNSRYDGESRRVISNASSKNFLNPRFSPNGKQLLFVSNRTGVNQIWIAKSDCSEPVQLTQVDFEGLGSPRWSPDGRRIAFDGRKNGPADVYLIDADGRNLQMITEGYMPSWSADGSHIYYVSNRRRQPQIWKIPVNGGTAMRVTEVQALEPLESQDGRTLYFTRTDGLWQKDLATGTESPVKGLENLDVSRYWDLTSRGIYFALTNENKDRIQLNYLDLETRRRDFLFELNGVRARWVPGISIRPDEQVIGISYLNNVIGDLQLLDNWN